MILVLYNLNYLDHNVSLRFSQINSRKLTIAILNRFIVLRGSRPRENQLKINVTESQYPGTTHLLFLFFLNIYLSFIESELV